MSQKAAPVSGSCKPTPPAPPVSIFAGVIVTPSTKTPEPEYLLPVVDVPNLSVPDVKVAFRVNVDPVKFTNLTPGLSVRLYAPQKNPVTKAVPPA